MWMGPLPECAPGHRSNFALHAHLMMESILHAQTFTFLLILQHEGCGPESSIPTQHTHSVQPPPPLPLPRLLPPKVQAGGGVKYCPMHRHRPNQGRINHAEGHHV